MFTSRLLSQSFRLQRRQYSIIDQVTDFFDKRFGKNEGISSDFIAARVLLKVGAEIRWKEMETRISSLSDLPSSPKNWNNELFIAGIYARKCNIGPSHFKCLNGLKHVEEMELEACPYLENECLYKLLPLVGSLRSLTIINCHRISETGLMYLLDLKQLESLELKDLQSVFMKADIQEMLMHALPNCKIKWRDQFDV